MMDSHLCCGNDEAVAVQTPLAVISIIFITYNTSKDVK